jgi:PTS system mannitol-specific IIA component/PTS system ascorbate-specific IIA component
MLNEFLRENIQLMDQVGDWKEAIRIAANPLKEKNIVKPEYVDSMIDNVVKNGSYIVIAPGIAIPHSRPENGVVKTGMSLLKLANSVTFPEEKEVQLIFVLAANDNETHLELISELANLIMEEEDLERLFSSKTKEEALQCIV